MKTNYKTKTKYVWLIIGLLFLNPFSSQAQFMRSYELKQYQSSLTFDSKGYSIEYAEFNGRESYFVGGVSELLANPIMLDFELNGTLKGGTLFHIPNSRIWKIKQAKGYRTGVIGGSLDIVFSGLVGAGTVKFPKENVDAIFLRTDIVTNPAGRLGNTPQWVSYGGEGEEYIGDLEVFKDGKYNEAVIMAGRSSSYGDKNHSKGYVIKTDAFGKLVKSIVLGGDKFVNNQQFKKYVYNDIEPLENGDFLLTGVAYTDGFSRHSVLLTRVDKDLNVIWNKIYSISSQYPLSSNYKINGSDTKEDQDGNLILFGHGSDGENAGDLIIWKLKNDGSQIWARTYRYDGIARYWEVEVSRENGRNKYLIASDGGAVPMLVKIDESGGLDWAKKYTNADMDGYIFELAINKENYALTGMDDAKSEKVLIIETSSNGNLLGNSTCKTKDVDLKFVKSIYPMISEANLSVTEVFDYEEHDLKGDRIEVEKNHGCWNIKYSRELESENDHNNPVIEKTISNAFPNPAKDQFTIHYNLPDPDKTATIVIHDIMGEKIKEFKGLRVEGNLKISTEDFSNGLFQYSIIQNGVILETHKMLINK